MKLKFLCKRCGIQIYPLQITHEEAENLNSEPLFRKTDIHCVVPVCECTLAIESDIVRKFRMACKNEKPNVKRQYNTSE